MECYNKQRYTAKKNFYRIKLGINQFSNYPFLNLIWVLIIVGTVLLINGKEKFVDMLNTPPLLTPIIDVCIKYLIVLIPVIISMSIIKCIGELTARNDEANLMLAFDEKDLKNGCPILIHKKVIRKKGVVIREFYSTIPMQKWVDKQENIADIMNVHFICDIEYGGKSNGNKILIKTAKGRKAKDRGILYDNIF